MSIKMSTEHPRYSKLTDCSIHLKRTRSAAVFSAPCGMQW